MMRPLLIGIVFLAACGATETNDDELMHDMIDMGQGEYRLVCDGDEPMGTALQVRYVYLADECFAEAAALRDGPLVIEDDAAFQDVLFKECEPPEVDYFSERAIVLGYAQNTSVQRALDTGDEIVIETRAYVSGALAEGGYLVAIVAGSPKPVRWRTCAEVCIGQCEPVP